MQKRLSSSSPFPWNRGGGGAPAAAWGSTALREEGEKEEGSERRRSPAVARPEMDRGGLATAATVAAPLWSLAAARSWGKRGREARGSYCAPYLGRRWREAAGPWRPAEAGGNGGGGGSVGREGGLEVAVGIVELGSDAEVYL